MDNDPCADKPLWSVLNSAVPDLTLAGVLAGFLIAVVAALVVQWYDRASPRMIALFASGVPALMISSYLFSIESGAKPPDESKVVAELTGPKLTGGPAFLLVPTPSKEAGFPDVPPPFNSPKHSTVVTLHCNQEWSQWLPAFAALLIGGSVLLCGLGWALVIYGDHLADRLKKDNVPTGTIEDYHRFFIRLSALLSFGATIGMTGLLIAADVVYLTATTRPHNTTEPNTTLAFLEFPHGVHWYAIFFVFLFGLYVVTGSLYIVFSRTTSFAWGEHGLGVHTKSPARRRAWGNKRVWRVAREIGIVLVVALGAFVAGWLTKEVLGRDSSGHPNFSGHLIEYVAIVAAVYAVGRLAYCGIVQVPQYSRSVREGRATTKGHAEADAKIPVAPSIAKPEGNYSSGWLRATSYHVVIFSVLTAAFTMLVTNGPLWNFLGSLQTGLILFIGGLYPAGILIGLSYSVPADPSVELPKWKNVTRVTLSALTRVIRKMLSDSTPTIPRSSRR
jgi:hypothetical protein